MAALFSTHCSEYQPSSPTVEFQSLIANYFHILSRFKSRSVFFMTGVVITYSIKITGASKKGPTE